MLPGWGMYPRPMLNSLSPSARERQLLEMQARALIGAVLAPHHTEDAQLGIVRLTAENRFDLAVFAAGELVLSDGVGRDHTRTAGRATDCSTNSKTTSPSLDPIRDSVARSG